MDSPMERGLVQATDTAEFEGPAKRAHLSSLWLSTIKHPDSDSPSPPPKSTLPKYHLPLKEGMVFIPYESS